MQQVKDWVPVPFPGAFYLSTLLLLVSCATMERARRHIFREIDVLEEWLGLGKPALTASRLWLAFTAVLGGSFLAFQWLAWRQLTMALSRIPSPAGYFLYLLSGTHAVHLFAGMLALIFCLTALGFFPRVESRQIAIDATAWFWHVMSATWVILFLVLRFGQ
jgi:cytochrome c oxidase subunit 3